MSQSLYGYVTFDHRQQGQFFKHRPHDFDPDLDHCVLKGGDEHKNHTPIGYLVHDPHMDWHHSFSKEKTSEHVIPLISTKTALTHHD